MTGQRTHIANAQQPYTLASRTSQRIDQSFNSPQSIPPRGLSGEIKVYQQRSYPPYLDGFVQVRVT